MPTAGRIGGPGVIVYRDSRTLSIRSHAAPAIHGQPLDPSARRVPAAPRPARHRGAGRHPAIPRLAEAPALPPRSTRHGLTPVVGVLTAIGLGPHATDFGWRRTPFVVG